jgi:hypothetical protein
MIIPEFRRAIFGRTHAQSWQPEAIEHYRQTSREWLRYAGFVGFLFFVLFGFRAVARYWG